MACHNDIPRRWREPRTYRGIPAVLEIGAHDLVILAMTSRRAVRITRGCAGVWKDAHEPGLWGECRGSRGLLEILINQIGNEAIQKIDRSQVYTTIDHLHVS